MGRNNNSNISIEGEGHDSCSGVDINRILQAATGDKTPKPPGAEYRRKKKKSKEFVILSHHNGERAKQAQSDPRKSTHKNNKHEGSAKNEKMSEPSTPKSKEQEPRDESTDVVISQGKPVMQKKSQGGGKHDTLRQSDPRKSSKHKNNNEEGSTINEKQSGTPEIALPKGQSPIDGSKIEILNPRKPAGQKKNQGEGAKNNTKRQNNSRKPVKQKKKNHGGGTENDTQSENPQVTPPKDQEPKDVSKVVILSHGKSVAQKKNHNGVSAENDKQRQNNPRKSAKHKKKKYEGSVENDSQSENPEASLPKEEPKDDSKVAILSHGKLQTQKNNHNGGSTENDKQRQINPRKSVKNKKNKHEGGPEKDKPSEHSEASLLKGQEQEPKDDSTVVILSRGKSVMNRKHNDGAHAKNEIHRDTPEISQLKQLLFEATRDLDKESNTRQMLENKVKSLSLELKSVKEQLGEDKYYCVSTLKEELDFEQKLRVSVQNDLSNSNDMVVSEQMKVQNLEQQIESEKRLNDSIKSELQAAKKELESEKALQHPVKAELSLERKRNQDLQKRLQYESAASIAIRMELQSIKGRRDRVEELEEELRLARCTTGQRESEAAEHAATKMELRAANTKLRHERMAAKESHSEVEELTQSMFTSKYKKGDAGRDQLLRKLRKELYETRAKLNNELRKNAAPVPRFKRSGQCPTRSLSDWVNVAPTNSAQHAGLIPILQSPPSTNIMPRPIETSLPGSTPTEIENETKNETENETEISAPPSSDFSSLFHYEEDDVSIACDEALEPLHDELTFIRNAYDMDEIIIEENKVTHLIELTTGDDSETVTIALTVTIPIKYPASGVLDVKASIRDSNCSHEVRKCAVDALIELEEICVWEAKANEGKESIHPIFSVASGWAHTDWHNILSKELPTSKNKTEVFDETSSEICAILIHTHHIIEADKIQSVKKHASKLSLGGYVKIGKPGLILVEGNDVDCDHFLEALVQSKKIFHTSTFKIGGRALRNVSDIDSCRCLPRKMEQLESKSGMDELNSVCKKLGLLEALGDIISH